MADYKTAAGAKKAIKDPLDKGAIKMWMVGALVLKWSQKVNGMTHKRQSSHGGVALPHASGCTVRASTTLCAVGRFICT